jgi:uncharacterized membrane protein
MAALLMKRESSMRGPLPPPELLIEYERALPGLGKTIVGWAEQEAKHRRKQDENEFSLVDYTVRKQLSLQERGMTYGLIVALAGFVATVLLAYHGAAVAAALVGSLDIVALVSVFVVGRHTQAKVEQARAQALPKPRPSSPKAMGPKAPVKKSRKSLPPKGSKKE